MITWLAGSFFTALILVLVLGHPFIKLLQSRLMGQVVRDDGPQSHLTKSGTPTMGGIIIVLAITLSALLWSHYHKLLWLGLFVLISLALVGWYDDFKKIVHKDSRGLRSRWKYAWQSLIAIIAALAWYHYCDTPHQSELFIPFWHIWLPIGWAVVILGYFVIVGTSNAVNLTDGLDGLVSVPVIIAVCGLAIGIWHQGIIVNNALLVLCMATAGATAGFLWFNAHPAKVFMGDVGALALGGLLGFIALAARLELALLIMGGIFVIEAISVILQVGYYKRTKKRIFKMAPIHHHFELSGWPETQVVVRFWLISFWLMLLTLWGVV